MARAQDVAKLTRQHLDQKQADGEGPQCSRLLFRRAMDGRCHGTPDGSG